MNFHLRTYKTISKTKLTMAYGFSDERTLVKRIRAKVERLTPEQLEALGIWTGNGHLMPDQVRVIVECILGTPESPEMVFSITKNTA